jgi:transcription termination factor NusB
MTDAPFKFKSRDELTAMSFRDRIEYFHQLIDALKRKEEELDAVINEAEKLKYAIRKEHE